MKPTIRLSHVCFVVAFVACNQCVLAQTAKETMTLAGHETEVRSVAFSPDGKVLASGAYGQQVKPGEFVGVIKLWDLSTGKESATLKDHKDSVLALVFSKDGRTLISASGDQTIKVWDLAKGEVVRTLKGHREAVYGLALSSDGKTLASGSYDKTVKLWDLATGKEIRTLTGHSDYVMAVAFAPDDSTLASSSFDKTIKLWTVATGKEQATLKGHKNWVISLAFSPDGKVLASGSADNTVRLWDLAKATEDKTLDPETAQGAHVVFTSDGKTLVSAGPHLGRDGILKVWDTGTKTATATVKWDDGLLWKLAISPEDRKLATTSNKEIKLWELAPKK